MTKSKERIRFFWKYFIRGLVWLIVLIAIYIFVKETFDPKKLETFAPLYSSPFLVFLIYIFSEVFFGPFPPEIFMIWALETHSTGLYPVFLLMFTIISLGAGILGYWVGKWLNRTSLFRKFYKKSFFKYEKLFRKYGHFLIVVAAVTPIPFSAVCMITGSFYYPFKRFLYFIGFRIFRFAFYGFLVWRAYLI